MLSTFLESGNKRKIFSKLIALIALGDFFWALTNVVYDLLLYLVGDLSICAYLTCVLSRASIQFWALSTVFTNVIIAIYLYAEIRSSQKWKSDKRITILCFLAYTLAFVLDTLLFTALGDVHRTNFGWCYPNQTSRQFFWFLPISISFVLSVLFIGLAISRWIQGSETLSKAKASSSINAYNAMPSIHEIAMDSPKRSNKPTLRMISYIAVFLIVWALDIGQFIYETVTNDSAPDWLQIATAITVNASGLLNFLIYGALNKQIRTTFVSCYGLFLFVSGPIGLLWTILKLVVVAIWHKLKKKGSHHHPAHHQILQFDQSFSNGKKKKAENSSAKYTLLKQDKD